MVAMVLLVGSGIAATARIVLKSRFAPMHTTLGILPWAAYLPTADDGGIVNLTNYTLATIVTSIDAEGRGKAWLTS